MANAEQLYIEYEELRSEYERLASQFKSSGGIATTSNLGLLRQLVEAGRAEQAKLEELNNAQVS